ncbi:hypothetical protein OGAPHI_007409 [Ogataea philodendri]|uniref:Importin N-terminal domain-containing protein n=1 Tax=Ogataea philodendri TaxID=1378263 RepID=A0A9P8NVH5_9ASCO|nr:uncharacterized protein OGAPHI_007409 [Ogataea philodendri]KAH3660204.1 hypothetical protein OGAPHI_007409 [Ogataea philodendri]
MDVQALHQCFLGTLQASPTIRKQAESQLKQAETIVGFLGACLDILEADSVEPVVKHACSIYFKNRILKYWADPNGHIDEGEKPAIRDRIIPMILKLERTLRNQFVPVLSVMISSDFPTHWPNYISTTKQLLLNTSDIQSMYTGVLCFSELARYYRWKTNANRHQELDPIIVDIFPSLLQIGQQFVANPSAYDKHFEAGEIVKLIIKSYKFVVYHDLPEPLQQQDSFLQWVTFHVSVINMDLPASVMSLDPEDRSLSPWVKSQKWAYANLYRLFERYGSQRLSSRFEYTEFQSMFSNNVVPGLLEVYFKRIEDWRQQKTWISGASMYQIILFLEQCVVQSSCFQLVQPHIPQLISEVAFPLLIPTEEVLDMFNNDPTEYIHMILDFYEETNSPQIAVLGLIYTLVEKRPKVALEPVLQFAYQKLESFSKLAESEDVAKEKESVLRIVGQIARRLMATKSLADQIEPFLASYILPNFKSQYAFLRARTCDVATKFDSLEFKDPNNLSVLFNGVLSCFNEYDSLPVQFEAARAIQAFLSFDQFKEALGSIIVESMEKLLELSNKVDSDAISAVIQECVECYSAQLQPFGANLMAKLSEQLLRLLTEIYEASNSGPDALDTDDVTDKHVAALGVFNTMVTVLLYFESSHELIAGLEQSYAPVVQYTFEKELDDFYAEAAELIENTLFLTRSVSPAMWTLFESMVTALMKNDLSIFVEDVTPSLKNYLVYGASVLRENKQYQEAFFQIIAQILSGEDSEIGEIYAADELASTFVLTLDKSSVAPYCGRLVQTILEKLSLEDTMHSSDSFKISLLGVVISGLVVNPNVCVQTLMEAGALESFILSWFKLAPKMKHVFDLKVSVLGFFSLLSIEFEALKQLQLDGVIPQIGHALAIQYEKLPAAISDLEKRRADFNADEHLSKQEFSDDWDEDEESNATQDYLQFLERESGLLDVDDDEYEEDPFSNTVLDNINVFKALKDCMGQLQAFPEKYQLLVGQLDSKEQTTLQNIVHIAQ